MGATMGAGPGLGEVLLADSTQFPPSQKALLSPPLAGRSSGGSKVWPRYIMGWGGQCNYIYMGHSSWSLNGSCCFIRVSPEYQRLEFNLGA